VTTTETPLAEPARYIEPLPVGALHPVAHNRELRDLDALAASIAKIGVLQPILVRTSPTGNGFEIIDGARRHAAATLAGCVLVPCIVDNTLPDRDVELRRIIANVQRDDPTELEEAAAYDLMITHHGMTASEVAEAVSRSDSHISKRRSLLALPAEAQAALADRRINVTTANAIAELAKTGDERRLSRVVDELPSSDATGDELEDARQELEQTINYQLAGAKAEQHRQAVIAELEKAGETVVDYPVGGSWAGTDYRVCRDRETAEAYAVDPRGHTMKLTTQPVPEAERRASVPKNKPKPADDIGFVEQKRRKDAQALHDAYRARVAVMKQILASVDPNTRNELTDHVLESVILADGDSADPELECELLGIDLDGQTGWSHAVAALDVYRRHQAEPDGPLRQALARIMATADPVDLREPDLDDPLVHLHYALLTDAGYQPTTAEQKALAAIDDDEEGVTP
jgi:ParB/RepB/Spo0J family partition protein